MRIIGLYEIRTRAVREISDAEWGEGIVADSEGVKVEWIAKSYEYNLSEETQRMCNKEMAEVILKKI